MPMELHRIRTTGSQVRTLPVSRQGGRSSAVEQVAIDGGSGQSHEPMFHHSRRHGPLIRTARRTLWANAGGSTSTKPKSKWRVEHATGIPELASRPFRCPGCPPRNSPELCYQCRDTAMRHSFELLADRHEPAAAAEGRIAPVKMWTRGVPVEAQAAQQLMNTATMPFIFKHLAVMPDVHFGMGSTVGSVIPTKARSFRPRSASTSVAE